MKALLPLQNQRGCLGVQNHPYSSSLTSIIIPASLDLENCPSLDLNNLKTEMLLVLPSLETRQTLISLVLRLTQYTFNNYTQYIMYRGSWQKRICIESMLLSLRGDIKQLFFLLFVKKGGGSRPIQKNPYQKILRFFFTNIDQFFYRTQVRS